MANNYLTYCQPQDVVGRMMRKGIYGFYHRPKVYLKGNEGEFGQLMIDMGDRTLVWNILIKDRNKILGAAEMAILNWEKFGQEIDY